MTLSYIQENTGGDYQCLLTEYVVRQLENDRGTVFGFEETW